MSDPDLSDHVSPPLDQIRLGRQWAHISGRLRPPTAHSSWWRPAILAAALVSVVVGVAVVAPWGSWSETHGPSALQDAVLESSESPMSVALSDGSHVDLEAKSQLRVESDHPKNVALHLARGGAHFKVTPDKERHFAVVVEGVEVRVVGTEFSVNRIETDEGRRVDISVVEGIVEIRVAEGAGSGAPTGVRRLTAGESLSTWVSGGPSAAGDGEAIGPETTAPATPKQTGTADTSGAPKSLTAPHPHPGVNAGGAGKAMRPDGRMLFEQAIAARRAGDFSGAARLYEQLLREYPDDPRAGLAALELGRLRADSLGDEEGANAAFEKAATLSKGSGLEEDALYRMVLNQKTRGDLDGCRKAQSEYLQRFPKGAYASVVESACRE